MTKNEIRPLLWATFISDFGSALTTAAIPLLLFNVGRSSQVGIYNGFNAVGGFAGSFLAMGLVDKFAKNRVAVFADIIRAALLIPLIFTDNPSFLFLLVFTLFNGAFQSTTTGAIQGWIAQNNHFSELELKQANASLEIAGNLGTAGGPAVGVLITLLFGLKSIFVIDFVTYLIGAALLIKLAAPIITSAHETIIFQMKAGVKYLRATPSLWRWIVPSLFQCFGFAVLNSIFLIILGERIHASEQEIFFFQMAYFVGSLIGGKMVESSSAKLEFSFGIGSAILATVSLLNAHTNSYIVFFALAVLQNIGRMIANVAIRTGLGAATDPVVSGRMMTLRNGLVAATYSSMFLVVYKLIGKMSVEQLVGLGAVSFALSVAAVVMLPRVKVVAARVKEIV